MSIFTDPQRRLLTYVQAANHGGCSPTPDEVSEWVERPNRKPGKVTRRTVKTPGVKMPDVLSVGLKGNAAFAETLMSLNEANKRTMETLLPAVAQFGALTNFWEREQVIEERGPDETLIEQALRFQWLRTSATGAGLVLTDLGRALLRSDADQSAASDVTILDGQDPLAWGALVGAIAEIGECVIVDPYLKPEQFLDVAKFTGTTRVILRRPGSERELIQWRVHQALPEVSVDIRIIDPQHIHDRYIVGETQVYGLGCSLAGVGRKPTTLVPIMGVVGDQIRTIVEGWWNAAEPVGDPPPDDQPPGQEAEADDSAKKKPKRRKGQGGHPKAEPSDGEASAATED